MSCRQCFWYPSSHFYSFSTFYKFVTSKFLFVDLMIFDIRLFIEFRAFCKVSISRSSHVISIRWWNHSTPWVIYIVSIQTKSLPFVLLILAHTIQYVVFNLIEYRNRIDFDLKKKNTRKTFITFQKYLYTRTS